MKKFYILLIIIIFTINITNAQWVNISPAISSRLNSIYFTSINIGYIVGDNGRIYKTYDSGNNWTLLNTGTTDYLESICFTDTNTAYVVGRSGTVLKTINSGASWSIQNFNVFNDLRAIYFVNSNTGFAIGGDSISNAKLLKTNNAGSNWSILNIGNYFVFSIFATDTNIIYLCGIDNSNGNKIILKTIDGGISWTIINSTSTKFFNSINFTNSLNGYIAAGNSILKTTDAGQTWTSYNTELNDWLVSIYFQNSSTGYAIGWYGKIYKTTDSGINWVSQQSNVTTWKLFSVSFTDSLNGFLLGLDTLNSKVVILKTTNGGLGIKENTFNNNISVYPNPVKDNLTIETNINTPQKLEISNLMGQTIYTIYINKKATINTSAFANGVYILKLNTDKETVVRKIVKE